MKNYSASVWKEEDSGLYVAQCLNVDIASQGRSKSEALANLREAVELFFETARLREIEDRFYGELTIEHFQSGLPREVFEIN